MFNYPQDTFRASILEQIPLHIKAGVLTLLRDGRLDECREDPTVSWGQGVLAMHANEQLEEALPSSEAERDNSMIAFSAGWRMKEHQFGPLLEEEY